MSDFPSNLFHELAHHCVSIQNKSSQCESERNEQLEVMKSQVVNLTAEEELTHQRTHEAERQLAESHKRDLGRLFDQKRQFEDNKRFLENHIEKLREEINRIEVPQQSDTSNDASLAIFHLLAPVRITEFTATRVSGFIAFGTADTTFAFEYDRRRVNAGIDQFWDLLSRASGFS
jgi:hypothetical protein